MAITDVLVPQLSESISEATLLEWKKQPGEMVQADEILIEVETDKVVLEVPAPASGVLSEIVKANGSTVTSATCWPVSTPKARPALPLLPPLHKKPLLLLPQPLPLLLPAPPPLRLLRLLLPRSWLKRVWKPAPWKVPAVVVASPRVTLWKPTPLLLNLLLLLLPLQPCPWTAVQSSACP